MHPDNDQFLRIEQGEASSLGAHQSVDETEIRDDFALVVPAGTWHNVVNTGSSDLKLYSIYAPPHHPAGTVHRTKAEAREADET